MYRNRLRWFHFLILMILIGYSSGQNVEIVSQDILNHIKVLASDRFEGRRAGTRGARKASRYITRHFRDYGLKPMGRNGHSFRKSFEFISGLKLGRRNSLEMISGEKTFLLELSKDFLPVGFSASGSARGELVFVGYGIESDELNYHDYGEIDVSGKIVMILRYSPDGTNPHGEFGNYTALRYKAMTAREQGAIAVVFVIGPEDDNDEDYLMRLKYDRSFADAGIPVLAVTQRWAKRLFQMADVDLMETQKEMNRDKISNSFLFPVSLSLEASVEKVPGITDNIVGIVEGTDPEFSDEYIVVGAHYDHLGMGGFGSMMPDTIAVHNGADDNASGTAGVLELAEWFGAHPQKRSLIFATFGGEEIGLLGSSSFVSDPPILLQKIGAMVNMDMIGRMQDSTVVIGGIGTSSIWKEMIELEVGELGLKPKFDDEGYGASDHQSFYLKDIPVLFFFTGTHENYHRPSDDWDKINNEGEERILKLVRNIIIDLAARPLRPDFVKLEGVQSTRGGFAVVLGTIPDYAATDVEGMKLSGVRKGGPADKGGLKGGDIIIKFGEKEVKSIYDFMYALQEAKAGIPVTITVDRNGEVVALEVIPDRRRD